MRTDPKTQLVFGGRAQMSVTIARRRLGRATYGWLLAPILLSMAALPDWRLQFVLSLVAVVAVTLLIGRSMAASVSGVLAAVTLVLLRVDPSGLPLEYRLIGLASALVCALPILTWRRREGTFPVLGTFCAIEGFYIYVGTQIGQPTLPYQTLYTLPIRELGTTTTFLYVTVLVAAGLGTRGFRTVFPAARRWTSRIHAIRLPSTTFTRLIILFVVGIAAEHLLPASVALRLGSIPTIVGSGRIVAVALAIVLWLQGSLTPLQRVVTVLGVLVDFVAGTNSGLLLYSGATAAFGGMIVLLVRRPRMTTWMMLAVVPLLLVLNIAKSEARADPVKPGGAFGAPRLLLSDALKAVTQPQPGELTASADRFGYSGFEVLGYVAYHVPRDYPYWNKESYTQLPLLLVPRVIVPFKPPTSLGNEFGREYGLLASDDFVTSQNTPLQVEAWANFGVEGLVLLAALFGGLLGLADGLFDSRTLDGMALGTLLAFYAATGIESGISGWAIAIPTVLVLIPVTHWALGPPDRLPVSEM
jgi:hypothetical protein